LAILLDPSDSRQKVICQSFSSLLQLRCLTFTFILFLYFKGKYALYWL